MEEIELILMIMLLVQIGTIVAILFLIWIIFKILGPQKIRNYPRGRGAVLWKANQKT